MIKYNKKDGKHGGYDISQYDDLIIVFSMLTNSYNKDLKFSFHRIYDTKERRFHVSLDHYLFTKKYPDKYEEKVKDWFTRDIRENNYEIVEESFILYEIIREPEFHYKYIDKMNYDAFRENKRFYTAQWIKKAKKNI